MSDLVLTTIALHDDGKRCFADTSAHVKQFCETHKWQVGVGEMAIGAALIAIGIQSGALQMGFDVVATKFGNSTAGLFGGTAGAFLGALPGLALGGIGVAAGGGTIAIPAVLLMGGGALILGLAGYGVGELVGQFLHPVPCSRRTRDLGLAGARRCGAVHRRRAPPH